MTDTSLPSTHLSKLVVMPTIKTSNKIFPFMVSALVLSTSVASAQSNPETGIEYVNDTTGIFYIVDQGWTGNFRYICVEQACINGELVNGRWQREVSGLSLGTTYFTEFKIQDNSLGQIIAPADLTFENNGNNPQDAGTPDTNVPDTSIPDTNVPDAGPADTNVDDTSVPDTSVPDTNVPDTSVEPIDSGTCNTTPVDPAADLGVGYAFGMTTGGLVYHTAIPGHSPSFAIIGLQSSGQNQAGNAQEFTTPGGVTYLRYEAQVNGVNANQQYTLEIRLQGDQFGSGQCIHSITVRPGEGVEQSPCFPATSGGGGGEPPPPKAAVATRVENGGARLVGGAGSAQPNFALYTFDSDGPDNSVCFNGCADVWPPLLVASPDILVGAGGVTGSFGTIERTRTEVDACGNSNTITEYQVTYNRQPLYFFRDDTSANDTNGASRPNWRLATAELIPQMETVDHPSPALPTPVLGLQPGPYGFTFDLDGRSIAVRTGDRLQLQFSATQYVDGVGDRIVGTGDPDWQFWCSNNQIQFHHVQLNIPSQGNFEGTVPGSCYGQYYYFFRYKRRGPVNNDPETRWVYTGLFVEDENNPGARVDPRTRPEIRSYSANWMRFRHPHAHDGNTEAIGNSLNNSSQLAGLARFTTEVIDGPNGTSINPSVPFIRIEALEVGHQPNVNPAYVYNTGSCCGNNFNYGQVVTYEFTSSGVGGISSQTYNTFQHIVIGQGFNSPLGDPRLTLAGRASTDMIFSDSGSHVDLEKDSVFTQHVITLTEVGQVNNFLDGFGVFHGTRGGHFNFGQDKIGTRTCGECHFRDGRGSEVFNGRLPPPVYGIGLLEHIEGRQSGFTWDGDVPTVRQQIENALRIDHGVSASSLGGNDLQLLFDYTEFLTVPNRKPNSYAQAGVEDGHIAFYDAGCEDCHQETQRTSSSAPVRARNLIIRPYTDMRNWNVNGGSFRTAPLWGLGTNIWLLERNGRQLRFMHDGSQTTLRGAIQAHGGTAASRFSALPSARQENLIRFLRTL